MESRDMKIKPIPDEPRDLKKENDLLGTYQYVETLKRIIKDYEKSDKKSYTIGLFGPWGSGKSSIIKTLGEELKKDENIGFFIYNAWKYSKDDFRRSFILELRKAFSLDTNEEEALFYKDKVEEVKFKPKIDVYSIALFFIALFLTFITSYFLLGRNFLSNILGSFTFSTLLSVIYSFFRGSLIYKRVSTTTPKLFSPEQFEERFKETIKDIRNKKNKNKIVIAIDEIDRCPKEQVLEILQTVKTFLEIENTVFIIAIDDQRLREFLDVPQDYANELLRKIFNTSIKLKAFSEQDLYHFGEKLAKEYGLEIPKTVISLVCQEFSKYPRKIIQFFNIFQNELYLACLQEEKNYIPKGTIRDNIEFFTKLLIIREHYPDIYKRLIDNRNLIQDIHQHIRDGKFRKNEDGRWKSGELKLTIDEDAYRFFRRTSHIEVPPDKIELFIFIKDVFKDIPDEFYQLIISQDWEQIKEKMEKNKIEFSRLLRFIDDIVDMDVVRRGLYGTTGFNVLSLLFKIIYKPRENKEGENKERENLIRQIPEYKNIMSLFSSLELWKWEYLIKYPPKEMMYSVKFFTETFKERVNLKEIIGSEIESQGSIKSKEAILVIIYYTKAFEDFSYIIMDKFKSIYNSPEIKHLLEDGFVENRIIPSLTQNYKENQTEEKVKVMEELHARRLLNDEIINAFVDKCLSMLGTLENHKNWEIFEFWLEKLNKFIGRYLNEDTKTKLFEAIQNNHSFIIQCYKDGAFEKVYKNWIDLITSFYLVSSNSEQKQNLIKWLNEFYIYTSNSEQKQNLIKWLNEFYIYTKYLIVRYEYIIENTYDYTFMPDILNIADKEDDLDYRIQLSNLLKLMVIRSKEDKGLNDEQIRQIVDFFFKNLFEEDIPIPKEKREGFYYHHHMIDILINIMKQDIIKQRDNPRGIKAIEDYLKDNIHRIDIQNIRKIKDVVWYISFEALEAILDKLFMSPDPLDNKKGILIFSYWTESMRIEGLNEDVLLKIKQLISKWDAKLTVIVVDVEDADTVEKFRNRILEWKGYLALVHKFF